MSHTALPPDGSFGRKHFQTSPRSRNYLARGENSLNLEHPPRKLREHPWGWPGPPDPLPCWRVRDHPDPEIWGDSAAESPESRGWAQPELALPRAACGRVTRQSQAQSSPFWHPPPANMGEMSLPPRLPGFCRCLCRCLSPPPGPGPCGQGRTGMSGRETTGPKRGCARRTPAGTGRQLRLRQRRPGVTGGFTPAPQDSGCFCR